MANIFLLLVAVSQSGCASQYSPDQPKNYQPQAKINFYREPDPAIVTIKDGGVNLGEQPATEAVEKYGVIILK